MRFPLLLIIIQLVPLLCGTLFLRAQNTPADRGSQEQENVQRQSLEIREDLLALMEELGQNSTPVLGSSEIRTLAGELADLDREKLAPLLEQLRRAMRGKPQDPALAEISARQKQIQVVLKKLETDLTLRINVQAVELRLRQLVLRQTTNLRETRTTAGSLLPNGKLPGPAAERFALNQSEQAGLQDEIALLLKTLQISPAELSETDRTGLARARDKAEKSGLATLAAEATSQTALARFPDCVDAQNRVLTVLQAMWVEIRGRLEPEERVQALREQFTQLAEQQKQAAETTTGSPADASATILEQQNQLADLLAASLPELTQVSATAARAAAAAAQSMEKAAQPLQPEPTLSEDLRKQVAREQQAAADGLQTARKTLDQLAEQLAAADTPAPVTPEAALQALAALEKKVDEAAQALDQLGAQPTAPESTAWTDQAAALQQEALALAPEAAAALGEASAQLAQSPAEAQAALQEAAAAIDAQMAALAAAAPEAAGMQAAIQQIAEAQAMAAGAAEDLGQGTPDFAGAGQQLQQAAQALAEAGAPAAAAEALGAAAESLASAMKSTGQSQAGAASAATAQAMQSMQEAQAALEQALAQMPAAPSPGAATAAGASGQPAQPGQPMPPGPSSGPNGPGMFADRSKGTEVNDFMGHSGPEAAALPPSNLSPRDRDALTVLSKEKTPGEYRGMVQQYLKNLAEGTPPAAP